MGRIRGRFEPTETLHGTIHGAIYRGYTVDLRMDGTILQYKHEDEKIWTDLYDVSTLVEPMTNAEIEEIMSMEG